MDILITGGVGYIGSKLIESLFQLNSDYNITVVDNLLYNQLPFSILEKCNFVKGDVRNRDLMLPLLKKQDIIIPLAAIVGYPACNKYPKDAVSVNVESIKWMLSKLSKEQTVIYPNTNSGYGNTTEYCTEDTELTPITLYGETKVETEKYIMEFGNSVVFRFATLFGTSPRLRLDLLVNDFVMQAMAGSKLKLYQPNFKRSFLHVNDAVNAFVFAVNNFSFMKNEIFNVGLDNANMTKIQLCDKIKEYIPNFNYYVSDGEDPDQRNYFVSTVKLTGIGFFPKLDIEYGIKQIMEIYPLIKDYNCNQFTNLR